MGTTRCFYFIKKNQLTEEDFRNRYKALVDACMEDCAVYYSERLPWIPVFATNLCEGTFYAEDSAMIAIENLFGSPVLVLSVFDDDVSFVTYCEHGAIERFVHATEWDLEEFGFEEYSTAFPEKLCEWGADRERLEQLWSANPESEEWESDLTWDLAGIIGTGLIYDIDEEHDGIVRIDGGE